MPNGPRNFLVGVTESSSSLSNVVTESKVGNNGSGSSTALFSSQTTGSQVTQQEVAMYGMVGMGVAMLVAAIFIAVIAYAVRRMRQREQQRRTFVSDLHIVTTDSQANLTSRSQPTRPSKSVQKWWRQVSRKKPHPQIYTIPLEIREQLKKIYVY